ncbi:MAG: EAL domain-containing protein [Nocardioidaceae bacterium]
MIAVIYLLRDPTQIEFIYLLSVPVTMLLGWFPVLVADRRTSGGLEIGSDICVLIFLATSIHWIQALVVWAAGVIGTQIFRKKPRLVRVFNSGLGILSGAAALWVTEVARADELTAPRELLAMGLGAAVYLGCDLVVTAISLSLEDRSPLLKEMTPPGGLIAMIALLAISSLGFLAALVVTQLPRWASTLLIVPVATILIASRAQMRANEHARRLKVLLDTAIKVQTVTDRPTLLNALDAGAGELVYDARVHLRRTEPEPGEIGVAIRDTREKLWLVSPSMSRAQSTSQDDHNGLAALAAVAEDALARLQLSAAMAHAAWHDPLTGLANRASFMWRVQNAIDESRGSNRRVAVLFCDLDGFKRVNDLFGHAAGDQLLVDVGHRIFSSVRQLDMVARLGGDEFAVLIEGIQDTSDVASACERILDSLRSQVHVWSEDVSVTTSIGVAWSTPDASADALLSRADLAMYHAKSRGKNRFEIYRPAFGDERRQRLDLVEKLRRSVAARELEVYYQPVVDLISREIHGVEALVRWRRDGELIPPDLFVPTAEESGLIVNLGEVVLDIVTQDAPGLRAAAGRDISIGANFSAQHLQISGFVDRVRKARDQMGAVSFVIEVTERDFVNHDPNTLATLNQLAAAGVGIAIDDFGVGFSSIGYLQRLPVNILKIDKSFISTIDEDPRACSLVQSIVVMSKALGVDVVIEGIERESQLHHLVQHVGATVGQGFLFAHPMPYNEIVAQLSAGARSEPPRVSPGLTR